MSTTLSIVDRLTLALAHHKQRDAFIMTTLLAFVISFYPRRMLSCHNLLVLAEAQLWLWYRENAVSRACSVRVRTDATEGERMFASALAILASYGTRRYGDTSGVRKMRDECMQELLPWSRSPDFEKQDVRVRALILVALATETYVNALRARGEERRVLHEQSMQYMQQSDDISIAHNIRPPSRDFASVRAI